MRRRASALAACLVLGLAGVAGGATIGGDERNERLTGTGASDHIFGEGGDDVIRGLGGRDVLEGGADNDRILGGRGNDRLYGASCDVGEIGRFCDNPGVDVLLGRAGDDLLLANTCVRTFCAAQRFISLRSVYRGGAGDDSITGTEDTVRCGRGRDRVVLDRSDRAGGCETVRRRSG